MSDTFLFSTLLRILHSLPVIRDDYSPCMCTAKKVYSSELQQGKKGRKMTFSLYPYEHVGRVYHLALLQQVPITSTCPTELCLFLTPAPFLILLILENVCICNPSLKCGEPCRLLSLMHHPHPILLPHPASVSSLLFPMPSSLMLEGIIKKTVPSVFLLHHTYCFWSDYFQCKNDHDISGINPHQQFPITLKMKNVLMASKASMFHKLNHIQLCSFISSYQST